MDLAQGRVQFIGINGIGPSASATRVGLLGNYISIVSQSHSHAGEDLTPTRRIAYSMKYSQLRSSLLYYQVR
jgi:hypothetical protein